MDTARRISFYPNKCLAFAEAVRNKCEELEIKVLCLVRDIKTRWNSILDMLKRLVELEDAVKSLLAEGWAEKMSDVSKGIVKLAERDWRLIKVLVTALEAFKTATLQLSQKSSCLSQYIPIVTCLVMALEVNENDSDFGVKGLKRRLMENLINCADNDLKIEDMDSHTIATLLDPRFKNKFFRDKSKQIAAEQRLLSLLQFEIPHSASEVSSEFTLEPAVDRVEVGGENNNLMNIYQDIKKRANSSGAQEQERVTPKSILKSYLSSKLEEDNLLFWSKYEASSEGCEVKLALASLARKYLTPTPTSTDVERLFSIAGQIVDGRERLLPENMEKLLFLRENLMLSNVPLDW